MPAVAPLASRQVAFPACLVPVRRTPESQSVLSPLAIPSLQPQSLDRKISLLRFFSSNRSQPVQSAHRLHPARSTLRTKFSNRRRCAPSAPLPPTTRTNCLRQGNGRSMESAQESASIRKCRRSGRERESIRRHRCPLRRLNSPPRSLQLLRRSNPPKKIRCSMDCLSFPKANYQSRTPSRIPACWCCPAKLLQQCEASGPEPRLRSGDFPCATGNQPRIASSPH